MQDISLASGRADVLGCEVSPAQRVLQWNGQTDNKNSFSRTDGLFAQSLIGGRTMELVNGHESCSALSNRGALSESLTPASSSRGRLIWYQETHGQPVRKDSIWRTIRCLLRSDWDLRWLDVCICTDGSEKGFPFAVREGCRELALGSWSCLGADKVHEKLQVHPCQVPCVFAPPRKIVDLDRTRMMSLARRKSRADFT